MKKILSKILACSFALVIPLTAFLITTNQKNVSANTQTLSNGTSLMNIFSDCDIYFTYKFDKIWFQNYSYEYTETLSGNINTHVGGSLYSDNGINNYIAMIENRVITEPVQRSYTDYAPLCTYRTNSIASNKVDFLLTTANSDYLDLHFNNFFIPFSVGADNFYNRFFKVLERFKFSNIYNNIYDISIKYASFFDGGEVYYETLTINDYTTDSSTFNLSHALSEYYNVNNLIHPYTVRYNNYDFACFDIDINVTSNTLQSFSMTYNSYRDLGGWYTIDDFNTLLDLYNNAINNKLYLDGLASALDSATPFEVVTNTVESFLNTEIFPQFKIYYFLLIAFGFALFGVVIKYAFGG